MTKAVAIVDTSVFCETLKIPNMSHSQQSRENVFKEFEKLLEEETSFLLPITH